MTQGRLPREGYVSSGIRAFEQGTGLEVLAAERKQHFIAGGGNREHRPPIMSATLRRRPVQAIVWAEDQRTDRVGAIRCNTRIAEMMEHGQGRRCLLGIQPEKRPDAIGAAGGLDQRADRVTPVGTAEFVKI